MGVFHILALLVAALPAGAFAKTARARGGRISARLSLAYVAAVALAGSSVAYEVLFFRAVLDSHAPSVLAALPLWFPNVNGASIGAGYADALLYAGIAETAALAAFLAFFPAFSRRERRIVTTAIVAMLACATLLTPATESNDAYLYVALATLGQHAYAPPNLPLPGDLHVINRIWGQPILASAYGPVWIGFSALFLGVFETLAAKLFALKVLGLATLLACAALARRLGAAPSVVAGIACNPGLYFTFVVGAHNDLFAVDLILLGMLAARRNLIVAFVCALAACLVKVTLVPVAVIAVISAPSLPARLAFASILTAVVSIVYLANGALLLHAIFAALHYYIPPPPIDKLFRFPLALIGLANAAWIVVAGRNRPQTGWAPAAFGDAPLPHYFVWGLPLVVRSTPVAHVFLVSLPLLMLLTCPVLPVTEAYLVASALTVTAGIVLAFARVRHGRLADA